MTPFADAGFDLVFCDHGAISFAAPERTIPEVARILRPGGLFVFNVEHPLHAASWADATGGPTRILRIPYFGLDRFTDADGSVGFVRPVSGNVELLAAMGFVVERLLEPRPAAGARTTYDGLVAYDWARDFPGELIVRARRG